MPSPADAPKPSALLLAAYKAALYAEAWPDDPAAQHAALRAVGNLDPLTLHFAGEWARAVRLPPEDLTLARLSPMSSYGERKSPWLCSREVGEVVVARVRAATGFPALLWRVAWVPLGLDSKGGAVVAWNANHTRTLEDGTPDVLVSRDKACLTQFRVDKEIQFRLGLRLSSEHLLTNPCTFDGVPALHVEPFGAVGDMAHSRRCAAYMGEERWREYMIPGAHHTWEEIVAAGGPSPDAR